MRKINIIPLAGKGIRFKNAKYNKPKPLIDVCGKPMIIRAAESLPEADVWIFICLYEHVKKFKIDKILKKYFINSKVIILDKQTNGQLSTVLKARKYIKVDDEIFIGNCDSILELDIKKFNSIKKRSDVIVISFKDKSTIKKNPEMYAYLKTSINNKILEVSCKKPFTNYPEKEFVMTGFFFFKRASYFIDSSKKIFKNNIKTNNEFYVDNTINYLNKKLIVKNLFSKNFINLGTPLNYKKNLYKIKKYEKKN
jgi:NDP-sugar pyrophosphorylase family protein